MIERAWTDPTDRVKDISLGHLGRIEGGRKIFGLTVDIVFGLLFFMVIRISVRIKRHGSLSQLLEI